MFDNQKVQDFFEVILGQRKGVAFLLSLERGNATKAVSYPHPFNWPEEVHRMVSHTRDLNDAGVDVYVCVGLFPEGAKRVEQSNVQSCASIWLDADKANPAYLDVTPSVVLETSPGSYQAFWKLEEPLDANIAQSISERLYHRYKRYGADKCWNSNRFMRIPTTTNHKPDRILPNGSYWEVKVLDWNSVAVSPACFDNIVFDGAVQHGPDVQAEGSPPSPSGPDEERDSWRGGPERYHVPYPDPPALRQNYLYPPEVESLWYERCILNRSDWMYRMAYALIQCGLDDADTANALLGHPITRDRISDKGYKRVKHDVEIGCIEKIRKLHPFPKSLRRVRRELLEETAVESDHDRKRILTVRELVDLPDLPWLIPNHVPAQGHVNFFGPSGVGKSLVVLDWGMRLSLGLEWHGLQITKIPVFYVVAEGLLVTKSRVKAWANHNHKDLDALDNIFFYGEPVYLMDEGSVARMQIHLDRMACKPGLIIFDTLSQCLSGVNENSPEVMSKINSVMIELRERYGCTTLVVHHTGYEGDHERGHSSFPAAADTRIKIETVMGQITVDCEKQRGGEPFDTIFYNKVVVDPSVVAESTFIRAQSLTEATLEPYHKKIMAALLGQGTLSSQEVQALSGMNMQRFTRYKAELQKSKLIRPADSWGKQIVLTPEGETMYKNVVVRNTLPKIDTEAKPVDMPADGAMF